MVLPAVTSIGGAYLAGSGAYKRTRTQKKNQRTIDDILAGLQGEGPYADLYQMDENAFQKSYVDPAKATFQNQIAPQIQQSYIASGLQRGTGLDDSLTRAGVDLDQMLNAAYMDYMNNVQDRRSNALTQILGTDVGGQNMSSSNRWNQAIGGYLTSPQFQKDLNWAEDYAKDAAQMYARTGFAAGA